MPLYINKPKPYPRIYEAYLFPNGDLTCTQVPIGLVHGKEKYHSVSDLEVRPWININNAQGVSNLSEQLFHYQVGELIFHIFVDPQDGRKAPSPHFRNWQGNVLVIHEIDQNVVHADSDSADLVKDAVRR